MTELFESHETTVDLTIEGRACISGLNPAAVACEKRQSCRRLQLRNQAADAGLRRAEFFSRRGHRSAQHHQSERFDLLLVHICPSPGFCRSAWKLVISKMNSRPFWP